LKVFDPQHEKVTPEFRVDTAMKTEQLLRDGYKDILSANARFNDNSSEIVRVHSNGFVGEQSSTYFGMSASVTIMDAGTRPAGSFFAGGRFLENLPSSAEVADKALFDTLRQIGQAKIASGRYTMIVDNRIAGGFLGRLFQPMSARNIQQRNSFLLDRLETKIASELLTIVDDPLIPSGLASRLFDNEGIAAQRRVLIDKGVLKTYLIDNYYGRKLGMTPNGGSASNILLDLGNRSQEQILSDQNKAILITSFNGGNANPTTGDFSFGISGQLIEKGKIIRSVNEMNISGNYNSLLNQLTETGNDPYEYSSCKHLH
jgi:PmbA protein